MRRRYTRLLSRGLRLALLINGLLAACTPAAWLPQTPTSTLALSVVFQPCQLSGNAFSRGDADCGVLSLPEDHANPSGAHIFVAVARLKALGGRPLPDPIFLLAGGPGQAATQVFLPQIANLDAVRQDHDLVIVDQRGTGSSNPLTCPSSTNSPTTSTDPGEGAPIDQVKACLAGLHADLRHYTTQDFVQDLEQVRQALGYDKIDLLGVSYGTRAALEYLRAYPDRVRALVLDGAAPPDWPVGADAPQNAQDAMDAILARCLSDPACQTAFPNLRQEFADLFTLLDRQPQPLAFPDPGTGELLHLTLTHALAADTLYTLSYADQSAALIPLLVHAAALGDGARLAAQSLIVQRQAASSIADGLYLSVTCAEDVPFFPDQPSLSPSYLPDGTARLKAECTAWPHAEVTAQARMPVISSVPALLLSGSADPVTPPGNAMRIAKVLPNSLQLTAPGFGHNVAFLGCLPRITAEFLRSASTQNLDVSCISAMRPAPFFINFSGPTP
jgi:pimeloyl-ACP methyl ester carboxylesterase